MKRNLLLCLTMLLFAVAPSWASNLDSLAMAWQSQKPEADSTCILTGSVYVSELSKSDLSTAQKVAEKMVSISKSLPTKYQIVSSHALVLCYARADKFDQLAKELDRSEDIFQQEKAALNALERENEDTIKIAVGVGIGLLFLMAAVVVRGYLQKKNANVTMLEQKAEVEAQKHQLEHKNREITDSINYASRIQSSILPPDHYWQKMLPDSFVLYLPKDIVSGDFYWVDKINDKILFAAVDCTGHGVPGAMMSVVGLNLLQDAVHDRGLDQPAAILSHLDDGVHQTLRQQETDGVKDGMDLGLCSYDPKTRILEYAGAYNPMYLVRDGVLEQTKADKLPIGSNHDGQIDVYTNHEFQLQPGDCVYLLTDGYADQFGGPKEKKFKYRRLREMLAATAHLPMQEQHAHLLAEFRKWQGNQEQVDDVCIIGMRIS